MKIEINKQRKEYYSFIFCMLLISGIVGLTSIPNDAHAVVYGELEPIPEADPTPESDPTPTPDSIPDPGQIPKPEQPIPKPELIPEQKPIQEPEPIPESRPTPAPEKKPTPKPSTSNSLKPPTTVEKSQPKINTNQNNEVKQKSSEIVSEIQEQTTITTTENEDSVDSNDLNDMEEINNDENNKGKTKEIESESLLNTSINDKEGYNEKSSPFSSDRIIFSVFSSVLIGGMVFYWVRKRINK